MQIADMCVTICLRDRSRAGSMRLGKCLTCRPVLTCAGVFETWAECEAQVRGFGGAVHKAFKCREDAQAFLEQHLGLPSSTGPAAQPAAPPVPPVLPGIDSSLLYRMVSDCVHCAVTLNIRLVSSCTCLWRAEI